MATTQHRPHSAFAGPLYGALDGKTAAPPPPAATQVTQHRPHGAFAGPVYGTLSGKTPEAGGAPTAPTIGTVTVTSSTTATVPWTDNSSDETGFQVQIAPVSTGTYTDAAGATNPTAANATSFTVTGLTGATPYTARVRAKGATADSAYSVSAEFTTDNPGGGGGGIPLMIDCGVGTAVASGLACAISASTIISCGVGTAVASGLACAITVGRAAQPSGGAWFDDRTPLQPQDLAISTDDDDMQDVLAILAALSAVGALA